MHIKILIINYKHAAKIEKEPSFYFANLYRIFLNSPFLKTMLNIMYGEYFPLTSSGKYIQNLYSKKKIYVHLQCTHAKHPGYYFSSPQAVERI